MKIHLITRAERNRQQTVLGLAENDWIVHCGKRHLPDGLYNDQYISVYYNDIEAIMECKICECCQNIAKPQEGVY